MASRWPFTKPGGLPIGLLPQQLTDQYQELEVTQVFQHQGHRFNFSLSEPADVLVSVSSQVADNRGWHRAGYLANMLTNAPMLDPVQQVERLYFGQQHLSVPYTGLPHYFEFWPHWWITDYRISLWAKRPVATTVDPPDPNEETGVIRFGVGNGSTEEFTFFGELIRFP